MEKLTKHNSFEELKQETMSEQPKISAAAFERLMELLRKRLLKNNSSGKRVA